MIDFMLNKSCANNNMSRYTSACVFFLTFNHAYLTAQPPP